jgi:transcriptional regulator of acetoin/glycerol metabolism
MLEELRNGGGPVYADDVTKEEVLRRYYVARVGMHGGVSQAARALGISRSTIQRYLRPPSDG